MDRVSIRGITVTITLCLHVERGDVIGTPAKMTLSEGYIKCRNLKVIKYIKKKTNEIKIHIFIQQN